MLNNKGFAVSTILYTILIAFLLFLGITLSMFSSSNSIISNANNDLVNGTDFRAAQVRNNNQPKENCISINVTEPREGQYYWYQMDNNILIKITSRYGVIYWPRDFIEYENSSTDDNNISASENTNNFVNSANGNDFDTNLKNGVINLKNLNDTYNNISWSIENNSDDTINLKEVEEFEITFWDEKNKQSTTTLTVGDICG